VSRRPGRGPVAAPPSPAPRRRLVPLDTAGMPPKPGPDFADLVTTLLGAPPEKLVVAGVPQEHRPGVRARHDRELEEYARAYERALRRVYRQALYDPGFTMAVNVKGRRVDARFVSGSTYNSVAEEPHQGEYGPCLPYEVMVVSKYPGPDEVRDLMNFVGPSSETLFRALKELDLADIRRERVGDPEERRFRIDLSQLGVVGQWYFTSVVKHMGLDPSTTALASTWVRNCAPLLEQELRLVLPKYILCFGTEAAKAVLGKKATVGRLFGRIVDKKIALHRDGDPPEEHRYHTARVMACVHPAYVGKKPEAYVDLVGGLASFHQLTTGVRVADRETGLNHVCLYSESSLAGVVDRILGESTGVDVIAVDAEWHGDLPGGEQSYLRTVQFSHKAKHAYCVVLHSQGGHPAFAGGVDAAMEQLRRLLKSTPGRAVRVGGHFFRADLPWLLHHGLDLRDEYAAARTPKGTRTDRRAQGAGRTS
jgi:uracil-DNA glycosylase family 4